MSVNLVLCFFLRLLVSVYSIPPEACFQSFRWDDCGQPPTPVMYYWKPGSRCEIGLWRGCLPNLNMFKTEYECSDTCIFSRRVQPDEYHMEENEINTDAYEFVDYNAAETTTEFGNMTGDGGNATTPTQGGPAGNNTGATGAPEGTGEPGGISTDAAQGSDATQAAGGDATTAAPAP